MITVSDLIERGSTVRKVSGAGARPRRGTASAMTVGPEHRGGKGAATDPGDQDGLQDGRRVNAGLDNYCVPYFVLSELIKGKDAYHPPDFISWGSTNKELVYLQTVWFFEKFLVLRIFHNPILLVDGESWVEYGVIPYFDVNLLEDFLDRTGINANDLEQP